MTRSVICALFVALVIINLATVDAASRVARSPQFGGGSYSQANAQAGAFGGQRQPAPYPPHLQRPAYGGGPSYGARGPALGGRGQGLGANKNSGVSISIAKSVSIGGGGRGGSGSTAQASSGARGK